MIHRKPRATVIKRTLDGLQSVVSTPAQTISQLLRRHKDQSLEMPASQSEDDREQVKFQTLGKYSSFQKKELWAYSTTCFFLASHAFLISYF